MSKDRIDGAKAVSWNYGYLQTMDDTECCAVLLTERQIQALLTVTGQQMSWLTRWFGAPSDYPEAFAQELNEALMACKPICELVADCIRTNSEVQNALKEYVNTGAGGGRGGDNTRVGQGDDNLLVGLPCDIDTICGIATAIVDSMAELIEQLFEEMDSGTNDTERQIILVRTIPVLGDLADLIGITDFVDLIQTIVDSSGSTFAAGYTPALRDDYICGLKQIMCDTCELAMDDITQYFATRLGKTVTWDDLIIEVIKDLFGLGGYSGEPFANFMFAMLAAIWQSGSTWLGNSFYSLATIVKMADPSNDCAALCPDCDGWSVLYDFANGNINGFTLEIGAFQSATGIGSVAWFGARAVKIKKVYPATVTGLTEIRILGHRDNQGLDPQLLFVTLRLATVDVLQWTSPPLVYGGVAEFVISSDVDFDEVEVVGNVPSTVGYIEIRQVEISGIGGYVPS